MNVEVVPVLIDCDQMPAVRSQPLQDPHDDRVGDLKHQLRGDV
jgi:hypothetical protein